jgi:hypothetical protein
VRSPQALEQLERKAMERVRKDSGTARAPAPPSVTSLVIELIRKSQPISLFNQDQRGTQLSLTRNRGCGRNQLIGAGPARADPQIDRLVARPGYARRNRQGGGSHRSDTGRCFVENGYPLQ